MSAPSRFDAIEDDVGARRERRAPPRFDDGRCIVLANDRGPDDLISWAQMAAINVSSASIELRANSPT